MRKIIIGILFFIIIAYFGIGFYVYGESVAVPCAVVESEKENRPDNFSLGEKADWDPSEYFVQDYETVLINTNDDVVLSGWWMETDKNAPTIIGLHGVTSGKHSPDVLLVGGMLVSEGFNYLTFDFRDHGESTCEDGVHSAGQKEIYDVKAAIDWLINENQEVIMDILTNTIEERVKSLIKLHHSNKLLSYSYNNLIIKPFC